jgi:hypothetical protein
MFVSAEIRKLNNLRGIKPCVGAETLHATSLRNAVVCFREHSASEWKMPVVETLHATALPS